MDDLRAFMKTAHSPSICRDLFLFVRGLCSLFAFGCRDLFLFGFLGIFLVILGLLRFSVHGPGLDSSLKTWFWAKCALWHAVHSV